MASPKKKRGGRRNSFSPRKTRNSYARVRAIQVAEEQREAAEEPEVPEVQEVQKAPEPPGAGIKLTPAQYEEMIDCLTIEGHHEKVERVDGKLRFTGPQVTIGTPGAPNYKKAIKPVNGVGVYYVDEPRMLKVDGSDREILPQAGDGLGKNHAAVERLYSKAVEKLKDSINNDPKKKAISNVQMIDYLKDWVVHCNAKQLGKYIGDNNSSVDWLILHNYARIKLTEQNQTVLYQDLKSLKETTDNLGIRVGELEKYNSEHLKQYEKDNQKLKDEFQKEIQKLRDEFHAKENQSRASLPFRKIIWWFLMFILTILSIAVVVSLYDYYINFNLYKDNLCETFCHADKGWFGIFEIAHRFRICST